nr:unnamed protein product [Callosobruchus analis]
MLITSKSIAFRNYIWGIKSIAFESHYHFLQERGRVTSDCIKIGHLQIVIA